MAHEFIDLGLTSGRLWAAENEAGYHQYDEAVKTFGKQLPSAEAWQELFDQCSHKWDDDRKGYVLTGPNGNTIFLPADSGILWNKETGELDSGSVSDIGIIGRYWTSSPNGVDIARVVFFRSNFVYPKVNYYRLYGFPVRLCKTI